MPAKKVVQDIVPGERRSVRKLTIENTDEPVAKTTRRKVVKPIEVDDIDEEQIIEQVESKKSRPRKAPQQGSFKYLASFIVILVAIIIIGVALSLSYSKAIITITPKVVNFNVNGTFTAKKSGLVGETADDLTYDVITASNSIDQSIPALKGALIQTKAKGVVVMYNNYSTSSQILVAGTRVASPSGLVYRTASSVSVPGKKNPATGIPVTIVADQAGDNYNLKAADAKDNFTLPGYKGTPKYTGFYGRLKMDLTGGFSGSKMTIDATAKNTAVVTMQASLKTQLLAKLQQSVPSDSTLYDGAYSIEYETPEPAMKDATSADMVVKGTVYGAIFKTHDLIKYMAGKEIQKFPSDTYTIAGDKALNFRILNSKDFSPKKATPLIFTLQGPIGITGTFSEDTLKNELKGTKLKDSNAVFAKYSSITNAYALITPFWLRSFPNSTDKITIEYKH